MTRITMAGLIFTLTLVSFGCGAGSSTATVAPTPTPPPTAPPTTAPAGNMVEARSGHSATTLKDGRILIAGGDASGITAEIYDPATGKFASTGSMNYPHSGHCAILLVDGRVLIVGGEDSIGPIASSEIYDPAAGNFTPIVAMASPRWGHSATLLPVSASDGSVIILAGNNGENVSISSNDVYESASGIFTSNGSLHQERWLHTATLLPSGKVLVAGGERRFLDDDGFPNLVVLATAEIFNPATGHSTSAANHKTERVLHTATLLQNGKVLITGGLNNAGITLSSAELLE